MEVSIMARWDLTGDVPVEISSDFDGDMNADASDFDCDADASDCE
jgi:hypothetical protein